MGKEVKLGALFVESVVALATVANFVWHTVKYTAPVIALILLGYYWIGVE